MTTALIYDPIFLEHITPRNHPERPQRLEMAMKVLEALNWLERDGLVQMAPRAASEDELAAVHDRAYIREVEEAAGHVAQEIPTINSVMRTDFVGSHHRRGTTGGGRETRFFAPDTY